MSIEQLKSDLAVVESKIEELEVERHMLLESIEQCESTEQEGLREYMIEEARKAGFNQEAIDMAMAVHFKEAPPAFLDEAGEPVTDKPKRSTVADADVVNALLEHLSSTGKNSFELQKLTGIEDSAKLRSALKSLLADGRVVVEGVKRGAKYSLKTVE